MKKTARDNKPRLKPVTHVELSDEHIKLRGILAIAFLLLGVGLLAYSLTSALSVEAGWQEVEVSSNQINCSGDFVLMYDFSGSSSSATEQYKRLTNLYTEATEDAFLIFTPNVLEDGVGNVAFLNAHVNETVEVEEALYQALELVNAYSDRHVFQAPATGMYNLVFFSESDEEAACFDPARNEDNAAWLRELAQYVSDPEAIWLELLGDNRVRLNVSDDYLRFAEENEIEAFLDFGWMTNAFLADYLANVLIENGFCSGYLVSYDGFTRNLDQRGTSYTFRIFDRQGSQIGVPAQMYYTAPASIVYLRSYPMSEEDRWHYYTYSSGEIVTIFLDTADCMSKSATNNLVCYSANQSCAEILLQTADVFIAEQLQTEKLNALTAGGVFSIWCEGQVIRYNDADLTLELTEDSQYTLSG